jgi:hypothetical protein
VLKLKRELMLSQSLNQQLFLIEVVFAKPSLFRQGCVKCHASPFGS